jgi:apolipoprotein N-acyltransferase
MITQLSEFFVMGGVFFMSFLTILLASIFLAAWKAPAWVWKIGLLALVCGILFGIFGFYQICDFTQSNGDIAPSVLMGGYKCMLVPTVYGIIIFIISLLIHIFQSPRI